MSAIAGMCFWDGRPISDSQLGVLAENSRIFGRPACCGTVTPAPGVALQAHVLQFDRLSATERQPHVFARGSVLTWDGRLDNRDDLLVTLHGCLGDDVSDAALVAAAYERWGLDAIRRLLGDWSLAIWDAPDRRLVLARDYMGNRPLYYLTVSGGLAWATSQDALPVCFGRDTEPDEAYLAGRLTYGIAPGVTPYKGLRSLRAGHVLVATEGSGVTVRRYWTFEPSRIRYRNANDYTDRLRELLVEAVRVRLRADRRVWSHLSGGFDSSSIVCIANTLIRRERVEAPALQPLSMVLTGSPESDESSYIEAVERWCGLRSVRQEWVKRYPVFAQLLGHRQPFTAPPGDAFEAPVHTAGDRIVLSGELGDLVMLKGSCHSVSLFEPLHEGHVLRFLRDCLAYAKSRRRPLSFLLSRQIWKAYAPLKWQRAVTQRRLRRGTYGRQEQEWAREVATTFGVTPALLAHATRPGEIRYPSTRGIPLAKQPLVGGLYSIADATFMSSPDAPQGVWRTFPYSHRPLVEFVIATPQSAFWSPRETRYGMKRALTGILPPALMTRTSKGDPTIAMARADLNWTLELAKSLTPPEQVGEWELVRRNCVQPRVLAQAVKDTLNGTAAHRFVIECVYLEAWLRTLATLPREGETVAWHPRSPDVGSGHATDIAGVVTTAGG